MRRVVLNKHYHVTITGVKQVSIEGSVKDGRNDFVAQKGVG